MANSSHKFNNQGMHFITYHRSIKENVTEELKRWERCKYNRLGKCSINNNSCISSNYCSKLELGQFQVKLKTKYESELEDKLCAGMKNDFCIIPYSDHYNMTCIGYKNCKFKTDKLIVIKENQYKGLSPSEINALHKSKITAYEKKQNKKIRHKKPLIKAKNKINKNKKVVTISKNVKQNTKMKLISYTDFQKSCKFFNDSNCQLFNITCTNSINCTYYKKDNI